MADKPKSALMIMIGHGKPGHGSEPPESGESMPDDEMDGDVDAVISELVDDIQAKNWEGVKQGLKALKEC